MRLPSAACEALHALEDDAETFANANVTEAGMNQQNQTYLKKFSPELLPDVRKGKMEPTTDVANKLRAGFATSPELRGLVAAGLKVAANLVGAISAH